MCGRFTLTMADCDAVADALEAVLAVEHKAWYRPRYNIAPGDEHWLLCNDEGRRRLTRAKWGMPSSSLCDRTRAVGFINARSETAATKPAFRSAFLWNRCGVAADGFFEWTGRKQDRRPVWFHAPDRSVIVFAGLYRDVVDPRTGEVTRRFTILTTRANAIVRPYHDRMPVILDRLAIDGWLIPAPTDPYEQLHFVQTLATMMHPRPDESLTAEFVSHRANRTENDDPGCIEPVPEITQPLLF